VFDVAIMLLAGIGLWEMSKAMDKLGNPVMRPPLMVLYVTIYLAVFFFGAVGLLAALLMFFVCSGIYYILDAKVNLKNYFATMFVAFYPLGLVGSALLLNRTAGGDAAVNAGGTFMLFFALLVALFTDALAYFTGMFYNKVIKKGTAKRLIPRVSPNKTLAGAIGGFISCQGIVALYWYLVEYSEAVNFGYGLGDVIGVLSQANVWWLLVGYILIGMALSVVSQFGDLFASRIKRECDFKDFGSIIPGHGGIIDRIDGVMFALVSLFAIVMIF
jgi:phosphatidate cytidylyltransferase